MQSPLMTGVKLPLAIISDRARDSHFAEEWHCETGDPGRARAADGGQYPCHRSRPVVDLCSRHSESAGATVPPITRLRTLVTCRNDNIHHSYEASHDRKNSKGLDSQLECWWQMDYSYLASGFGFVRGFAPCRTLFIDVGYFLACFRFFVQKYIFHIFIILY